MGILEEAAARIGDLQRRMDFFEGFPTNDMVRIYDDVLTASAASVDITGIPQTYRHLMLVIKARSDRVPGNDTLALRLNGSSANSYYGIAANINSAGLTTTEALPATYCNIGGLVSDFTGDTLLFSIHFVIIPEYTNVNLYPRVLGIAATSYLNSTTNHRVYLFGYHRFVAEAISRVSILPVTGPNLKADSCITLYGLR